MSEKDLRFPVKAVINKEKTRVLFAVVDNNLADIMFHFSTLSLGLVMETLLNHFKDKTPVFGSLNNLYESFTKLYWNPIEKLNSPSAQNKNICMDPSGDPKVFTCLTYPSGTDYFSFLKFFSPKKSFIIREDELRIFAEGKGSIVDSLSIAGVTIADMNGAEMRNVTIGFHEIMYFLSRFLISRCPLSDIILGTAVNSELPKIKPEAGIPLRATSNGKMMILKLTLKKSTNKLLYAQTDQDFVNYLFSVLLIPLGRINFYLGSNTCPINIDALFTSVTDLLRVTGLIRESVRVCDYLRDIDTMATKFPLETFFDDDMFMITDDLSVNRYTFVSSLLFLDELKIPLSDVKEVELQIGIYEVLSILKASLTSTRALTDGLINPKSKKLLTPKHEK